MVTIDRPSLRSLAADALQRARRMPIGEARNDLRQLAMSLIDLSRRGIDPGIGIILALHEKDGVWFLGPDQGRSENEAAS